MSYFIHLEFRQKLNGVTDKDFPDLIKPVEPPAFKQGKGSGKNLHDKPKEEIKTVDVYDELEDTMKKNNELFKRHKIDPNRPDKKKNQRKNKKKGDSKMHAKQEDFPGLPGS